jgi:hypothetical protein
LILPTTASLPSTTWNVTSAALLDFRISLKFIVALPPPAAGLGLFLAGGLFLLLLLHDNRGGVITIAVHDLGIRELNADRYGMLFRQRSLGFLIKRRLRCCSFIIKRRTFLLFVCNKPYFQCFP